MFKETFDERHALGVVRLTGGNRGLFYTNERQETVEVPTEEGGEPTTKDVWAYDVYEVEDARSLASVKNGVIGEEHPKGDEQKIDRKAIAKILQHLGLYDDAEFEEFKAYNEFCNTIN